MLQLRQLLIVLTLQLIEPSLMGLQRPTFDRLELVSVSGGHFRLLLVSCYRHGSAALTWTSPTPIWLRLPLTWDDALAAPGTANVGPMDTPRTATYVAVEVKRHATVEAVDQLVRYLEALERDPMVRGDARGIVAAVSVPPKVKRYAWSKGLLTVELDYDELRGHSGNELRLF